MARETSRITPNLSAYYRFRMSILLVIRPTLQNKIADAIDNNTLGAWRMMRRALPMMNEAGHGRIVNVSSESSTAVGEPCRIYASAINFTCSTTAPTSVGRMARPTVVCKFRWVQPPDLNLRAVSGASQRTIPRLFSEMQRGGGREVIRDMPPICANPDPGHCRSVRRAHCAMMEPASEDANHWISIKLARLFEQSSNSLLIRRAAISKEMANPSGFEPKTSTFGG